MDRVIRIVEEQLFLGPGRINDRSSAIDVDGWDSLAALRICMGIEECFSLKFTTEEMAESFGSVPAILAVLRKYQVLSN